MTGTLLFLLVCLPFAGAAAAGLLPTHARNAAAWLAGSVAVLSLAVVLALDPASAGDGVIRHGMPWMPSLGISLSLRLDGFAWLFAALVTGIGALVAIYARYYMAAEDPVPRFFAFLLAFMGSMLGLVLSGNLLQIAFFWEMTSLFSFLLIAYRTQSAAAREGARMALTLDRGGRAVSLCRDAPARPCGRQLRSRCRSCCRGTRARASGLSACPDPDPARSPDQVGPVPLPFLAAAGDGRADAGFGLSAFGNAGEGGGVPAGPALARARGDRGLVLDRRHGRSRDAAAWRLCRDLPERPEGSAGLFDDQPSGPDHPAAGPEQRTRPCRRRLPHREPRDLQGLAVHGRRHHRSRDGHARHPPPLGPCRADALHRAPGHRRRRRHGRRAAAQRLPVQGDVLCRGAFGRGRAALPPRHPPAGSRRGQRLQRRLFAAADPRCLLRPAPFGSAPHPA
ncbi:NADH:ubiquinone oxidoreductase subunit 5 (chain L)/Multisubunit Na+/H+ antiporter, MnhA subunit [Rubellimicrobium thermophilum DSM 16684]|uniref:NADH:ubiquinone oxidoreductase subunit 5 (Chain L)/Multisubunit Na+/H+ antiporter, MnhA subunit n=1 Tax=Rubellimicrobium thermophilum DSM 16684 TaxID=1123069 RepID=S9R2C6_9RHOB|nr:NADH:ubiquinone oxidoreductase subunit 5 (chain L)/Multisubunit Na+/H+ antiporter, MnhA subunit [Rubellimicrobium thermophilum DSM 16684]